MNTNEHWCIDVMLQNISNSNRIMKNHEQMQRFRFLSPSPTPADTLSHSRGDFPGIMQVTKDTRYIRSDVTWAHAHLICWWWRWVWLGVRIPCWYWPGSGTGRWFQDAAVWSCGATCSTVTTPEQAAAATALTGRTNARYCSWSGENINFSFKRIIYRMVPLFETCMY